jgi:glutathionyl-hydroquinone reductase
MYTEHTYNNLNKQPNDTVGMTITVLLVVYSDYCRCGRYSSDNYSNFWLFIKIIVSVVGIAQTITITFGCLFRLL